VSASNPVYSGDPNDEAWASPSEFADCGLCIVCMAKRYLQGNVTKLEEGESVSETETRTAEAMSPDRMAADIKELQEQVKVLTESLRELNWRAQNA